MPREWAEKGGKGWVNQGVMERALSVVSKKGWEREVDWWWYHSGNVEGIFHTLSTLIGSCVFICPSVVFTGNIIALYILFFSHGPLIYFKFKISCYFFCLQ